MQCNRLQSSLPPLILPLPSSHRHHPPINSNNLVGHIPCPHHPKNRLSNLFRFTQPTDGNFFVSWLAVATRTAAVAAGKPQALLAVVGGGDGIRLTLRKLFTTSRQHLRMFNKSGSDSVDRDTLFRIRGCEPVNEAVESGFGRSKNQCR